jgi:ribosomal protein L20
MESRACACDTPTLDGSKSGLQVIRKNTSKTSPSSPADCCRAAAQRSDAWPLADRRIEGATLRSRWIQQITATSKAKSCFPSCMIQRYHL